MTFPANPLERSPKGDHNRRLSLGLDAGAAAARAAQCGIRQMAIAATRAVAVDVGGAAAGAGIAYASGLDPAQGAQFGAMFGRVAMFSADKAGMLTWACFAAGTPLLTP